MGTDSTFATKQDDKNHLLSYVNFFFPENLNIYVQSNKTYFDKLFENFQSKKDTKQPIQILIGGAGVGVFEFPLLKYLIDEGYILRILAYDHSLISKRLFIHTLDKLFFGTEDFTREIFCKFIADNYDNNSAAEVDSYNNEKIEVIYKNQSLELDSNPGNEREDNNSERINVKDTGIDYAVSDFITQDIPDNWDKFDIVIFSSLLHHISYWRSLIAYCNNFLTNTGFFLINELSGDNLLVNGDPNRWRVEDYDENKENLYSLFQRFYGDGYSIISDNKELSATNLTILKHFLNYLDCNCFNEEKINFLELKSIQNVTNFDNIIKENLLSSIYRNNEQKGNESKISQEGTNVINLKCKIRWYKFNKITNPFLQHFDIIRDNHFSINNTNKQQQLKSYISEVLDLLYSQRSLYSFHILNYETRLEKAEKVDSYLKSIVNLFRRFILLTKDKYRVNLTIAKNDKARTQYYINTDKGDKNSRNTKLESYNTYFDLLKQYDGQQNKQYNNNDTLFEKYKSFYTSQVCFVLNFNKQDDWHEEKKDDIYQIHINKFTDNYGVNKQYVKLSELFNENKNDILKTLEFGHGAFGDSTLIIIPFFTDSFIFGTYNKQFVASLNVIVETNINDNEISELVSFYSWIINKFIVFSELNKYLDFNKYTKLLRQASIKSAISAIMSRNMSHNLGSHVITNTRYQIENLSAKSDQNVQKQLNGVTALLEYLQERQDFVAVIANEDQYAKGPLNFKTAVFDMLAMDGPAKRHAQNGGSNTDRQIHNYVLDNIVRSEEIYRDDNIAEIQKGKFPIEIQMVKVDDNGNLIFKSNPQATEINPNSSNFTDIQLAVPYGLNGRQAFLVILENIIRNAAKHYKEDLKSDLTFSIIIKETDKNYEITIADNKQNYNKVIKKFKDKGNEPDRDKSILDETGKLKKLNILNKDVTGGIDRDNKGIKEILIALSWLTSKDGKVEYHKIEDEDDYNSKLLKIDGVDKDFNVTNEGINLSLGYQFTIDKYLEFYEVTPTEIGKLQELLENEKEFSKELAKLTSAFIYVFPTDIERNLLEKVKKHLTRVVQVDLGNMDDKHNKIIPLYESLIKSKLYNGKDLPILIAENKTNTEYNDTEPQLIIRKHDNVSIASLHNDNDYILYINHYENRLFKEHNLTEEEKAACKTAKFVEGISGGNFTHNLIRTKLDKLGYLKIIEAALTKIAIVDERIFHRFNGIATNKDTRKKVIEFKQQADKTKPFMFYSILQNVFLDTNSNYNDIIKQEIVDNFDNENKLANIFTTNFIKNPNENDYYNYLAQKNIFIFNSKSNDNLDLIDLNGNLLLDNDINFNFISIHLGLIDKIKEAKNKTAKEIIEEFKTKFSKSKLVIHSGRGGLANADNVGFIPFSGIDWAVDNCKYVLAELFYGQLYK